jgi:hypothetical protein
VDLVLARRRSDAVYGGKGDDVSNGFPITITAWAGGRGMIGGGQLERHLGKRVASRPLAAVKDRRSPCKPPASSKHLRT